MKKLPKVIPAHAPVQYRIRSRAFYGEHLPSCRRGKNWIEVSAGYDHEAQAFVKRKVSVHQIVALGEGARKPLTPQDFCYGGSVASDYAKKVEVMRKRYPQNFQERDAADPGDLHEDRSINVKIDKRAMRRWLKESEKNRNNSPLPPVDKKMPKRIVRKLARKKYHGAMTVKALIRQGALKV